MPKKQQQGFFYFFPGATMEGMQTKGGKTLNPQALAAYHKDLPRVFADCMKVRSQTVISGAKHREAGEGVCLYPLPAIFANPPEPPPGKQAPVPESITYRPETQEWTQVRDYWIGYERDNPPTAKSLERTSLRASIQMTDVNGNVWRIPLVGQDEDPLLSDVPLNFDFTDDGDVVPIVKPEYSYLYDLSERVFDLLNNNAPEIDAKERANELARAALTFLQLNHRISIPEVQVFLRKLGVPILDNERTAHLCSAAVGRTVFDDHKKKEQPPASSDATPGPEEGSPNTVPQSTS